MRGALARWLLAAGLLAPALAWPSDPPHDSSSSPGIQCLSCHMLHKAPGLTLTNNQGNANLCASCHLSRGPTFAWDDAYQAVPGSQGRSHRWDSAAVNATYGASLPTDPELLSRITVNGGNLLCSSCHDQHLGASTVRGHQRVSVPVGTPVTRVAGGGSGTFVVNAPLAAANPKGYRVEVVLAGATGVSRFRVSNDNGLSWFGEPAWTAAAATGVTTGASLALNDGSNVTVTFSGTFAVGDRWDFYVSYPMLRMTTTDSALCVNCHPSRVQSAAYVEGPGDGATVFSHPVGVALSKSYDRASNAILDSNGQAQTTGDGLATNDLALGTGNIVHCLTCHSPHGADSNSLTEDPR